MKVAIINADDLGISTGTNAAVEAAFRHGSLTSASLMVNMPAFDDAVTGVIARNPRLGIGLHLVLTSGAAVSRPERIPLLVNAAGVFTRGFLGLARLVSGPHAAVALAQVECELEAQCARARQAGIRFDHLDSHRHVHMIPAIWSVVVRLAERHGCRFVRLADERLRSGPHPGRNLATVARNLPKKVVLSRYARLIRTRFGRAGGAVRTTEHFAGVLGSGAMRTEVLCRTIARLDAGVTEILTHPGIGLAQEGLASAVLDAADRRFVRSPNRRLELEALLDRALLERIGRERVVLSSFGELSPPHIPIEATGPCTPDEAVTAYPPPRLAWPRSAPEKP